MLELPATDLVKHRIPTCAQARPTVAKLPLFMKEEVDFQRSKFPEPTDAGISISIQSLWCARAVHSYCSINDATIKGNYPMQKIEPIRYRGSQKMRCSPAQRGHRSTYLLEAELILQRRVEVHSIS